MRVEAFTAAARIIAELPAEARARVVSLSVLGEVHDMFPNFIQGPSETLPMTQLSDYSPMALHGFRAWLEQRFGDIGAFNQAVDGDYPDFASIHPPSRDAFRESAESLHQHVDLHAAGSISIYGWIIGTPSCAAISNISCRF